MGIQVQNYQIEHCESLAKIFEKSILASDDKFYNASQKSAWLGNHSLNFWQIRFAKTLPLIALFQDDVVGFAEFLVKDNQGEIDCFYIDPNFQQLGVGKALLTHILTVAKQQELDSISVNASHNAKPFLEKQGFKIVKKNSIIKSDITLENWLMVLENERNF